MGRDIEPPGNKQGNALKISFFCRDLIQTSRLRSFKFFVLIVLISCACKHSPKQLARGFYYWKGTFDLSPRGTQLLRELGIQKLYVRFFDVGVDEGKIVPMGSICFAQKLPGNLSIVPVVFISNKSIKSCDPAGIELLAQRISGRLSQEIARTGIAARVPEIQIDCDWTNATKTNYFHLLQLLGERLHYPISATIRLHQYRYFENNVPPVSKGLLMCYNSGELGNPDTDNSLFDKKEIMKYMHGASYPLRLDIALPLYSWGVCFNRVKLSGLLNGLKRASLEHCSAFKKTGMQHTYVCLKDTFAFGYPFFCSQQIRLEEPDLADVTELASYLTGKLENDSMN